MGRLRHHLFTKRHGQDDARMRAEIRDTLEPAVKPLAYGLATGIVAGKVVRLGLGGTIRLARRLGIIPKKSPEEVLADTPNSGSPEGR